MPEAEDGNRTEKGKMIKFVHVQSDVACANKWCMCRQVARPMRTKGGSADKYCLCRQMLHMLTNVAISEKCGKSRGR